MIEGSPQRILAIQSLRGKDVLKEKVPKVIGREFGPGLKTIICLPSFFLGPAKPMVPVSELGLDFPSVVQIKQ